MPRLNGKSPRRKSSFFLPHNAVSTKVSAPAKVAHSTRSIISASGYSTFQAWRGSSNAEKCSIRLFFAIVCVMAGSADSKPPMNHSKFQTGIP